MRFRVRLFAVAALLIVLVSHAVEAAPLTFATRQAFDAALGPHPVITFDDLAQGEVATCLPPQPPVTDPCVLALDDQKFRSGRF